MKRIAIIACCALLSLAGSTSMQAGLVVTICHRGQTLALLDGTLQLLTHLTHGDLIGRCVSQPSPPPPESEPLPQ